MSRAEKKALFQVLYIISLKGGTSFVQKHQVFSLIGAKVESTTKTFPLYPPLAKYQARLNPDIPPPAIIRSYLASTFKIVPELYTLLIFGIHMKLKNIRSGIMSIGIDKKVSFT